MEFSLEHIRQKTKEEAEKAVKEGRIVSSETDIKYDGVHPETGRDLDTPSSFVAGEIEVWTLDKNLTPIQIVEIAGSIAAVVRSVLPEELKDSM